MNNFFNAIKKLIDLRIENETIWFYIGMFLLIGGICLLLITIIVTIIVDVYHKRVEKLILISTIMALIGMAILLVYSIFNEYYKKVDQEIMSIGVKSIVNIDRYSVTTYIYNGKTSTPMISTNYKYDLLLNDDTHYIISSKKLCRKPEEIVIYDNKTISCDEN